MRHDWWGIGIVASGLAAGCGNEGGDAAQDSSTDGSSSSSSATLDQTDTSPDPTSPSSPSSTSDATMESGSNGTDDGGTSTGDDTSGGSSASADGTTGTGGGEAVFEEVDGIVSVEAEHYHLEENNAPTECYWYTFAVGRPDPDVQCVTDVVCGGGNQPNCNEHPDCDGDADDPAEAVGGAYVEALPDRRRTDEEAGTGNLGVVNNQEDAARLVYHVEFTQTGRYYVWARAKGEGPAANGLHVGLDGTWPENDLIDPSSMRLQFPSNNQWTWTQNRRGGTQHTGVQGTAEVSQRDANVWIEIDAPGMHDIVFAMREDGLELDKIVLALDPEFEPEGDGPPETTSP